MQRTCVEMTYVELSENEAFHIECYDSEAIIREATVGESGLLQEKGSHKRR